MGRHRSTTPSPDWFDVTRYVCDDLDEADWFLNLWARLWIWRGAPSRSTLNALPVALQALREAPIIRRLSFNDTHFIFASAVDDPEFLALLRNERPPLGIESLTVSSLYYFEGLLPSVFRKYARSSAAAGSAPYGQHRLPPEGYTGPLDDALPNQYVGRFARINLALSDEELLEDLKRFVSTERERLRHMAPEAPFLKSLARVPHKDVFATWCSRQVLAVIDLEQWVLGTGEKPNWATIERWITEDPDATGDDTRKAVKLIRETLRNDLALRNFLLPLARKKISG